MERLAEFDPAHTSGLELPPTQPNPYANLFPGVPVMLRRQSTVHIAPTFAAGTQLLLTVGEHKCFLQ